MEKPIYDAEEEAEKASRDQQYGSKQKKYIAQQLIKTKKASDALAVLELKDPVHEELTCTI